MYAIAFKRSAIKELNKVPTYDKERVVNAIYILASNPFDNRLDAKKLKGDPSYRLRVGDWRIIYDKDEMLRIISVTKVGHRREVYQ